jgi:hypothetical protein
MKRNIAVIGTAALVMAAVTACHDHGSSGSSAPTGPQSLDTAQVLEQARHTTETGSPSPVNNGALTLTDTGDTSEPISVNAN